MDPFSPAHEPDEGYSEDPLNPSANRDTSMTLSSLRSAADLPSWLASNAASLPVSVKKGMSQGTDYWNGAAR